MSLHLPNMGNLIWCLAGILEGFIGYSKVQFDGSLWNPETTESKVFKYFLVRSTKTVSGNYTLLYLKVSGLLEYDAIITALTLCPHWTVSHKFLCSIWCSAVHWHLCKTLWKQFFWRNADAICASFALRPRPCSEHFSFVSSCSCHQVSD
jgi:hypothetical protein